MCSKNNFHVMNYKQPDNVSESYIKIHWRDR